MLQLVLVGLADGMLQLVLVGLLHGSELLATTLGLGGLLIDNTRQVLDLGIGLLVVLDHHSSELVNLLLELGLGLADGIHGIELHAASGSGHLGVLLGLHVLVLLHLGPHGGGTSLELVLGVLAVLGKLVTHGSESLVELKSHFVHLLVLLHLG